MSSWTKAAIEASTIDAIATAMTTARTDPRSMPSGATDAVGPGQGHDRQRRRRHRRHQRQAVSGTASVRRAAHGWNGIAPNRIATASANAR